MSSNILHCPVSISFAIHSSLLHSPGLPKPGDQLQKCKPQQTTTSIIKSRFRPNARCLTHVPFVVPHTKLATLCCIDAVLTVCLNQYTTIDTLTAKPPIPSQYIPFLDLSPPISKCLQRCKIAILCCNITSWKTQQ